MALADGTALDGVLVVWGSFCRHSYEASTNSKVSSKALHAMLCARAAISESSRLRKGSGPSSAAQISAPQPTGPPGAGTVDSDSTFQACVGSFICGAHVVGFL